MYKFIIFNIWLCLITIVLGDTISAYEYNPSTGRGVSLLNSTWPSDHGDTSRSKFTLNAGLPKQFDPDKLKRIDQTTNISFAQWIYTGGPNGEYVYIFGGPPHTQYVAKLDSLTLEIVQVKNLPPTVYTGGLLMHENGHVYAGRDTVAF
jgi:hypothetical protein